MQKMNKLILSGRIEVPASKMPTILHYFLHSHSRHVLRFSVLKLKGVVHYTLGKYCSRDS